MKSYPEIRYRISLLDRFAEDARYVLTSHVTRLCANYEARELPEQAAILELAIAIDHAMKKQAVQA